MRLKDGSTGVADAESRFKGYVVLVLVLAAAYLALQAGVIFLAERLGWSLGERQLFHYQLGKLADAKDVHTVFVGDSALGNAIDARRWSELSAAPALNLALTASYGHGGSVNMLLHALRRHPVRNAVIMQTVEVSALPKEVSDLGFLETTGDLEFWKSDPQALALRLQLYTSREMSMEAGKWLWSALTLSGGRRAQKLEIAADYVPQGPLISPEALQALAPGLGRFRRATGDPYLSQIAQVCRMNGINCVYAFATVWDRICETGRASLEDARKQIERAGLKLVAGTPVCVPAPELGNAENHVRPDLKRRYTDIYFRLIAPYLREGPRRPA